MGDNINILIAPQPPLPHYRVTFYNFLFGLTKDWKFTVIYDEGTNYLFHYNVLDKDNFQFKTQKTKTHFLYKFLSYQDFIWKILRYDGIIIDDAINNISYPLSFIIAKLTNKKIIYWGHGKDNNITRKNRFFIIKEFLKLKLVKAADGYLAYTNGVREYLINEGVKRDKIFVLNNTVDIQENHELFLRNSKNRDLFRKELGLNNCRILLYVGRFDARKKMDLLFHVFDELYQRDNKFRLIIIGWGSEAVENNISRKAHENTILYLKGIIDSKELVKYYVASDLFFFPGDIGLGPLTSLSFNLPVMVIDSETHNPEFEYLNSNNAIILEKNSSIDEITDSIISYFDNPGKRKVLEENIWSSINHLTLANFANNFDNAMHKIFDINQG